MQEKVEEQKKTVTRTLSLVYNIAGITLDDKVIVRRYDKNGELVEERRP